ncbi:MAG: SIS domain-containing protein [Thermoplasmatales archaeon]|nr:SIS domain-containing protein [Thermoplasmatales archaeon]MCW6170441.1 SIS domain-containing protein [Thermoplasmatales archaeon]
MDISLEEYIREGLAARSAVDLNKIKLLANRIYESFGEGGKIIAFGNGGSAADAQHFVAELDGHFSVERKAFPAIALTTNTSSITAIGNDYSFDDIFSRPVEALTNKNDVVFGISTSGNSKNVINGILSAKAKGAYTVGLTGKKGGKMRDLVNELFSVQSDLTPIIQEVHIAIIHMICLEIDNKMVKEKV